MSANSEMSQSNSVGSFWKRQKGAIYSILSSLVLASTGVFVKKITSVSKTELAAFRVGGQYIFLLPYVLTKFSHQLLPFHDKKLMLMLLGRGIAGIIAMLCFYNSFEYLPIGETSTLLFSSAVILNIMCWLFLGESLDCVDWSLLSVSIIGCVFIARPTLLVDYIKYEYFTDVSTNSTSPVNQDLIETEKLIKGVSFGLVASFFAGISFTFIRAIGKTVHFTVTTFYYTLVGSVLLWPIVYLTDDFKLPARNPDVYLLCCLSVSGFIAQGLRTLALQHETAFLVSVYGSTQLLFAFSFDYGFYRKTPDIWSASGASLILFSVLAAGYRKARITTQQVENTEPKTD